MNDFQKKRIQKKICAVHNWADIERDRIENKEREMLAKIRDKCEHEMEWEHRLRDSVGGGYYVYLGICQICGLEINQKEKPEGIDKIPETHDTIIFTM